MIKSEPGFLWLLLCMTLSGSAGAAAPRAPLVLVKNHQPRAAIVTGEKPHPWERLAARELQKYLQRATGALLPIRTVARAGGGSIFVGRSPATDKAGLPPVAYNVRAPFRDEAFRIRRRGSALFILGNGPRGTLYGVYEFLHRLLGVRWLEPGEAGEYVPRRDTLQIDDVDWPIKPSFETRAFGLSANLWTAPEMTMWARRNRINMTDAGDAGLPWPEGHSYYRYVPPQKYFASHPEYFAEVGGQRRASDAQLETANPDVVRIFAENLAADLRKRPRPVISLSPNDGYGWSESAESKALDQKLQTRFDAKGRPGSDRIFDFSNRIAERLAREFRNTDFITLAYVNYTAPPVTVRLRDNVIPWVTHYTPVACYTHAQDDPKCATNTRFRALLQGWIKVAPRVYTYNYSNKWGGWENVLRPVERLMARDVKYQYRAGVRGYYSQSNAYPWASLGPIISVTARLAWDAGDDPDAILSEHFRLLYGTAAKPMLAYHREAQRLWERAPVHANTNPARLAATIFPAPARARLHGYLKQARGIARSQSTLQRIHRQEVLLHYSDLYIALHQSYGRWKKTKQKADIEAAWSRYQQILALAKNSARAGVFNATFTSVINRKWGHDIQAAHRRAQQASATP